MTNTNTLTKTKKTLLTVASLAMTATGMAGPEPAKAVVEPDTLASRVSGTLSLQVNTHFISYGADVWGSGSDWDSALFNPSLDVAVKLSENWSLLLGTWWDVNDKSTSSIGASVQEVDLWAGLAYTHDKWTFTALYQEWMYASDSERIVDFKVSYDTFLKPYILFHGRVDGIGPAQDTGVVGVIGGAYDFKAGPIDFSIPGAVAFMTDGFQGGTSGFGYASLGLNATYAFTGFWEGMSVSAGVTYYHTNDSVIPNNPDTDFVTGTAGVSFKF